MAKWSLEGDTDVLQTIDSGPEIALPPVGAVFEKSFGGDITERIKEAAARAKSHQKESKATIQVDAVGSDVGGLRQTDAAGIVIEDRLDKARKLIKEIKFQEALTVLLAFLKENRSEPTATYLKALCECRLSKTEEALRTLAPVIRSTPHAIDSQVRQLRADIREAMLEGILTQTLALVLQNQGTTAVRRLEDLLSLDPEVPIYHCLRIHTLLIEGHLPAARAAVDAASPFCPGRDGELLEQLRQDVLRQMLELAIEPARSHYRSLHYRKARKALDQIKSEWGDQPLWQTFNAYLQGLGGGLLSKGKDPSELKPPGDFRTVDQLHFLLVREEIVMAKRLLGMAQPEQATAILIQGNGLTPFFPYLHYLIGQGMYLTILMGIATGKHLDIDEFESRLDGALKFAESGAKDPEIAAASELVGAIQEAKQAVTEVRKERARIERDNNLMRPFRDEFIAIMKSAEGGITSTEHFRGIQRRLKGIQDGMPSVKRNLNTAEGGEHFKLLSEATARNLKQISKMEPEIRAAEDVAGFQKRLNSIMENLSPGSQGLPRIQTSLKGLKGDVNSYLHRRSPPPNEAISALNDLLSAINGYLSQLAEAAIVNPFVERFQVAISILDGRAAPIQRFQAIHLREEMTKIVAESGPLKNRLTSPESKEAVENIRNIAMDVIKKIPF